jgi:nucleoid-associated protein YgaU
MGLFDFLNKGNEKKAAPQANKTQPAIKPNVPPQAKPATQAQAAKPASPAQASTQQPGSAAKFEMYTVKEGDWLSKIAGRYYGDVHKWDRIFQANRDQISDPDKIRPGQILKIPLD